MFRRLPVRWLCHQGQSKPPKILLLVTYLELTNWGLFTVIHFDRVSFVGRCSISETLPPFSKEKPDMLLEFVLSSSHSFCLKSLPGLVIHNYFSTSFDLISNFGLERKPKCVIELQSLLLVQHFSQNSAENSVDFEEL